MERCKQIITFIVYILASLQTEIGLNPFFYTINLKFLKEKIKFEIDMLFIRIDID